MTAVEKRVEERLERLEEKLDKLEAEINHARMESVVEKRKEVERMRGVVGEIREESLGLLREEWRREREAMREREEAAGREREKLRREMEGQMEEMRRMVEELGETVGRSGQGGGETCPKESLGMRRGVEERVEERGRRRCVVMVDSNGKGVTPDTIRNHIHREERREWEVQVEQVFRLEEARDKVRRGEIRVGGAKVVVDCMTNDVRGTRAQRAAEPWELEERVRLVIEEMRRAGAEEVVLCEVKPMQHVDVVPFNARIHALILHTEGVGGCSTQIQHGDLGRDGYHVRPEFGSVLDRTYACAVMHRPVPCPYFDSTIYDWHLAREREREWPPLWGGDEQQARAPGSTIARHLWQVTVNLGQG